MIIILSLLNRATLLLSLVLGAILLTSCSLSPFKPSPATTLRVVETGPPLNALPVHLALKEGFFRQYHLQVRLTRAEDAKAAIKALEEDRADVALLESAELIRVYGETPPKEDLQTFCALTARPEAWLLARKPAATFNWSDLKGKVILGEANESLPSIALTYALRQHNLRPQYEVTVVDNLEASMRAGAFSAGSGDYFLAQEPLASELEAAGTGHVVASLAEDLGEMAGYAAVATTLGLHNKREALQGFTNGIYLAQQWLYHQLSTEPPDRLAGELARSLAGSFSGMTAVVLSNGLKRYFHGGIYSRTPRIMAAAYNRTTAMASSGQLLSPPKHHDLVREELARQAEEKARYHPPQKKRNKRNSLNRL